MVLLISVDLALLIIANLDLLISVVLVLLIISDLVLLINVSVLVYHSWCTDRWALLPRSAVVTMLLIRIWFPSAIRRGLI